MGRCVVPHAVEVTLPPAAALPGSCPGPHRPRQVVVTSDGVLTRSG